MTQRELLIEAGQALYGLRWQVNLAATLNVSDRTIRGWSSGDRDIPPDIWPDIAEALSSRADLIGQLLKVIPKD